MKRVTYYPQVVLGFHFAWTIFIDFGALEMIPLSRKHLFFNLSGKNFYALAEHA